MTQATVQALQGLRDLSLVKWYIIPLLAIVFYIYTKEIKEARKTGDWNAELPEQPYLAWIFLMKRGMDG